MLDLLDTGYWISDIGCRTIDVRRSTLDVGFQISNLGFWISGLRLTVSNLSKRFGRRWLFRDLSFELNASESLAITGSNGSGKTTLLRLIAGVLTPTRGTVELSIEGSRIPDERRSFHMGLVAPYLQLYEGLTLRENLRFVQRVRGSERSEPRLDRVVDEVGLSGRSDDLISTYSSGMKQRAKFAVALVVDPEFLLLDEPSTNMDESGIAIARRVLDERLAAGKSVVVATNSRSELDWCSSGLSVEDFL